MRIDMPTCQYGEHNCRKRFDGNCLLKPDLLDECCPTRRTINDILKIIATRKSSVAYEQSKDYKLAYDAIEQHVLELKETGNICKE